MKLSNIRRGVRQIRGLAGDCEVAHRCEDALWQDVLQAIADGDHDESPAALAIAALKTTKLSFDRWYA